MDDLFMSLIISLPSSEGVGIVDLSVLMYNAQHIVPQKEYLDLRAYSSWACFQLQLQ